MDDESQPVTAIVAKIQPLFQGGLAAPFTTDLLPPQEFRSSMFVVRNEVIWPTVTPNGRLKGPPQIRLQWNFRKGQKGTLVVFRRREGFGADGKFGEIIVKSNCDDYKIEQLEPGEYFYSCFIVKGFLGLFRCYTNEVLFTQTMPSAAKVLEVMRQAIDFTKLHKEFQSLTEPPPRREDSKTQFEREFTEAMASIDQRFEASKQLNDRWKLAKRKIRAGPESDAVKEERLRVLNGMMREFREKFQL